MQYILIGSLRRHGGKLLARLFDGHPDLYALPLERRFGQRPRCQGRQKGVKNLWPELAAALTARDARRVAHGIYLRQYHRKLGRPNARRPHLSLDPAALYLRFVAGLEAHSHWTRERVLEVEVESFYRSLNRGACWTGARPVLVNHCATSIFLPLERFFAELEGSRFVYSLRNPLAYYASIKKRAVRDRRWNLCRGDDRAAVDCWMERWKLGVTAALCAKLSFKERFLLLRYEDVVTAPEESMRWLAGAVDLRFQPTLVQPTSCGRPWGGNSSFGPMQGLSRAPLDHWKSQISEAERDRILERVDPWMRCLGYGEEWRESAPDEVDGAAARVAAALLGEDAQGGRLSSLRQNAALRYQQLRPARSGWRDRLPGDPACGQRR